MKITKRQLRKILRETILDESRHRRSRSSRYGHTPHWDGDNEMDAKNALSECFRLLDDSNPTKSGTSGDLQWKIWQMIRKHYEI